MQCPFVSVPPFVSALQIVDAYSERIDSSAT